MFSLKIVSYPLLTILQHHIALDFEPSVWSSDFLENTHTRNKVNALPRTEAAGVRCLSLPAVRYLICYSPVWSRLCSVSGWWKTIVCINFFFLPPLFYSSPPTFLRQPSWLRSRLLRDVNGRKLANTPEPVIVKLQQMDPLRVEEEAQGGGGWFACSHKLKNQRSLATAQFI